MWENFLKEECSSKSQPSDFAFFDKSDSELSLSKEALIELLRAVFGKGLPFRFRAGGSSMHPFIRDGDVITLHPLPENLPRLGDVVAYVQPQNGRLTVHRVVGKTGHSFLIRGDNLLDGDGAIPEVDILGYVTAVERDGKWVTFGLGSERRMIAFLSRRELLFQIRRCVRFLVRFIVRR